MASLQVAGRWNVWQKTCCVDVMYVMKVKIKHIASFIQFQTVVRTHSNTIKIKNSRPIQGMELHVVYLSARLKQHCWRFASPSGCIGIASDFFRHVIG